MMVFSHVSYLLRSKTTVGFTEKGEDFHHSISWFKENSDILKFVLYSATRKKALFSLSWFQEQLKIIHVSQFTEENEKEEVKVVPTRSIKMQHLSSVF